MRIAFCGTANQNILQFSNDFRREFPMYSVHKDQFNTVTPDEKNSLATQITQSSILNTLLDDVMKYDKNDNILFNYSLIDNLVTSMWLNTQEMVSDHFIKKSMVLIKQALHFYDMILYFPNSAKYTPPNDSDKDLSEERLLAKRCYEIETGNLYTAIHDWYLAGNQEIFDFNSIDGCPALIEIFGNAQERIEITKLYIDKDGQPFGRKSSDSLITLPSIEEQHEIDKIRAMITK